MRKYLTKKQALSQFNELWNDHIKRKPHYANDRIAKRCAFNDYVDKLHKSGQITQSQYHNWKTPF